MARRVFLTLLPTFSILTYCVLAVPAGPSTNGPTVSLDDGTFLGTTVGNTTKFLGIPYAQAPTGDLRFNLPMAVEPYTGSNNVMAFGPSCPQQFDVTAKIPERASDYPMLNQVVDAMFQVSGLASEDCLNLNVWIPSDAEPGANLPVVAWIYGGGFEVGGTSPYDGGAVVERSIELGQPIIYVSMNYRLNAFGFLASQEVKDAGVGNLGLQDQRLALRWIQKYIGAFGGDPTRVTIAGSMSASFHMLANGGDTEGLFHGAFMQSGSPSAVSDITAGQGYYDALVSQTGCTGSADTLQCLRQVPYADLKHAVDMTPGIFGYEVCPILPARTVDNFVQSVKSVWGPHVDGVLLTDTPISLVQEGKVANIPYVTGDCDDEGTLFSFSTLNITDEASLREYFVDHFAMGASNSDIDELFTLYPEDLAQGSPFGTDQLYAITPEYKRIAALLGDVAFQAPRRFFLDNTAERQPAWSFLSKRLKTTPYFGSAHGTDLLDIYYTPTDLADYLINFVNNLDPNGETTGIAWPQYDLASRKLLTLSDGGQLSITEDTFRADGINLLAKLTLQ
ncbi:Lipase 1 [Grifola frondosa]|uniref:Lipase 1 n=1 Tax=Grifola frondosa TaxID=5627 RepID=A0A1C7MFH0_GRIFR|nr:Lipase 1 [Grifola frondosa]